MDNKIRIIAHLDIKIIEEHKRLYSPFGLSPTLNVVGGGGQQPKLILPSPTQCSGICCNRAIILPFTNSM